MSQQPQFTLDDITSTLATWGSNFKNQSTGAFARMTAKDWIRLVIVVGAYALLRPYLIKIGANFQQKQFEKAQKQELAEEEARQASRGGLTANDLRSGRKAAKIHIPGVESSDEDSEAEIEGKKGEEWGRTARVRQRRMIRKIVENHEKKLADKGNESDKDIEDLLED